MNLARHAFERVVAESERYSNLPARHEFPPLAQKRVRAILLDLCGVLIDDTLWSRWLFQLVSRIGLQSHYELFWRVWQQDYQLSVNLGKRDYWDALRSFLAASGLTRGQIDEVCHAALARRRHLDETVRPFPGVKGTLAKLQLRGWRLGVISNSPRSAHEVRQRLDRLGIATPLELIVSSSDLPPHPPSLCRYEHASAAWKLAPHEILFVSTSAFERDAAARAGMVPIAMPRPSDTESELAIEHVEELLQVLPEEHFWSRAG